MTGKYREGLVQWSFLRKVNTGDKNDVSLDECRFFLFPVEGGVYNQVNKKIRKHDQSPIASSEKICIPKKCRAIVHKKPSELRYEFDIKLTGGLGDNWKPPKKGSEDFQNLKDKIDLELSSELKNLQGFSGLHLTDIKRYRSNGKLRYSVFSNHISSCCAMISGTEKELLQVWS